MAHAPILPGLRPHEQAWLDRMVERGELPPDGFDPLRPLFDAGEAGGRYLARVQTLLAEQGYQSQGSAPATRYECEHCQDGGELRRDVPPGHPDFGRGVPCFYCRGESARAKHRAWLRNRLRHEHPVPGRLLAEAERTLSLAYLRQVTDLDGAPFTPQMRTEAHRKLAEAFRDVKQFAHTLPEGGICALDGPPGAAKSHLAAKVVRYAWLKGLSAAFITGGGLNGDAWSKSADEIEARYIAFDLLAIDEADHAYNSGDGRTANLLFRILDERQKAGRCTVLTGNELERLWPALRDRARSASSLWIDLSGVPSGRPFFMGTSEWQAASN